MNPLVRIISTIIDAINRAIERTPKRTLETIRRGFFLVTALLMLIGVIIGHQIGKKGAQKMGTQIAERTNDIFDIDIKLERKGGDYDSMLDTDLLSELRESNIKRVDFPVQGRLEPELNEGIIEPASPERAVIPPSGLDLRDRIMEPARTDESRTSSEVKNLKRRTPYPSPDEKSEIISEKAGEAVLKPGRIEGGELVQPESEKPLVREERVPTEKQGKKIERRPLELKPLQKDTGIIKK